MKRMIPLACFAMFAARAAVALSAPTPEEVFANPPPEAHAGVWWHWMGAQVTREGIAKDLDWMSRMGITSATIFGMCDTCSPWAKRIANVPTGGLRPYSDAWWGHVKFACAEGRRRGIAIGMHNCPGYTCTGGKWITPQLAMRRLVFNVTNAVAQISTAPEAAWPVYNEDKGKLEKPACEGRQTDYRRIGNVNGIEIGHIPTGAYVQPADWDSFGLECDKMSPEAVDFHLDHVLGEMKRHLGGDLPAAGLRHVLLDSYEAGTPSWTPKMREEFRARRGYDCLRYLPILGGFTQGFSADECAKFRKDFDRTVRDLYRDVLFKRMGERIRAEGLAFSNEPYGGPFDSKEAALHVDRIMTEFWYKPNHAGHAGAIGYNAWRRADGTRHNVVEAEAFSSAPQHCHWDETPALLKPCGDRAWLNGVNRFVLHTCPLQPWGDDVKPGVTMGRWGSHFGRNQTWAESGRAWFDYIARAQALLQWGEPSDARTAVGFAQLARSADGRTVHFIANEGKEEKPLALSGDGAWFDPVDGSVGAPPKTLAPHQSGFWVTGRTATAAAPSKATATVGGWEPALGDWTKSEDPETRYFSGARRYRAAFEVADAGASVAIDLGCVLGATAAVRVNGRDCGVAWCAPWRVKVPAGVLKAGRNAVEVEVVNVWANRLIGDEQEPSDVAHSDAPAADSGELLLAYPDWFAKGVAARPSKGRRCFVTWNYFSKDSPLVPSGLVGPVRILE